MRDTLSRIGHMLLFAAVMLLLTTTARGQSPRNIPDPPPVAQRVNDLEARLFRTEAAVERIERMLKGTAVTVPTTVTRTVTPEVVTYAPFDQSRVYDPSPVVDSGSVRYTTPATTARSAGVVNTYRPDPDPFGGLTYTAVPRGTSGITSSGCANGSCGSAGSAASGRFRLFRR
jgi:hypothetical protein